MSALHITCYRPVAACGSFTFYLLSKGANAGRPNLSPWVNSFAVHCANREELDFYFWLCHSLWQVGRFKPLLRGSVIPFLSVSETSKFINGVGQNLHPHWEALQPVVAALNTLRTARAHLAQCIIANERLQGVLLRVHF